VPGKYKKLTLRNIYILKHTTIHEVFEMTGETITYRLEVPKELWERLKEKVPHSKKMNDAVVELIKKEVGE